MDSTVFSKRIFERSSRQTKAGQILFLKGSRTNSELDNISVAWWPQRIREEWLRDWERGYGGYWWLRSLLVAGDARSVNRPAKYAVSAIVTSIRSKTVANDDTAKKRECLPRGPTPPSTRTRTQRTHPSLAPEAQDNATRKRERES